MTIDRTGYAVNRRASGWEGIHTDTVPSGPSVSRDAEGAGTLPTPDAFSRYARATASSDATGRPVTAMPESTSRAPSRTTATPHAQAIAAAKRRARTHTATRAALPDGREGVRFQASDVFGYSSLPWSRTAPGTWLYRMLDSHGDLLYIGISGALGARMDLHRTDKPWWPEVDHVVATMVGPEHIALDLERAAIRAEMPRHNRRSKPGAVVKAVA